MPLTTRIETQDDTVVVELVNDGTLVPLRVRVELECLSQGSRVKSIHPAGGSDIDKRRVWWEVALASFSHRTWTVKLVQGKHRVRLSSRTLPHGGWTSTEFDVP